MKRVFKNPIIMFVLGALIFSSISVYATHKYYASDITYKDTTLDQALDTLYTTQNTTVTNLQSQVSSLTSANATLTNEKSALLSELNNINANNCYNGNITLNQSSTTSSGQKILNFKPTFILWDHGDLSYALQIFNGNNTSPTQYNYNLGNSTSSLGWSAKSISDPFTATFTYITSNSVKIKNFESEHVGKTFHIIVCK